MVALERLDADSLRDLSRRTDKIGVLSVYVDADPKPDPNLSGVATDLKNRFRELQRRMAEDKSERGRDVTAALERVWTQIEWMTSPMFPGRGRVAFFGLGDGWTERHEIAMPVANRLVLDDGPFIHPLLEALDEGRPAGVIILATQEARLLEWRVGTLQTVSVMEQPYVEAPHERAGQIGGGPPGQFNAPVREQRQARERVLTERFVEEIIGVATELAGQRAWERILLSGGPRWTESAVAKFPPPLRDNVFGDTRVLSGLDDAELAATVTEWAHEQHREREKQLVDRIREATGHRRSALGLSEVAGALNVGRVAHLVYDPEVRYVGSVGADGSLYAGDEVGPTGEASKDPRFTERLIERALETRATVSPVEGAAKGELRDAEGVAALLRW